MRARSLKPSFFKNEELGSSDPLHGCLFQGLWCAADREGRLEDRPMRLCVEIFPYRREVTEDRCDRMLQWLHDHGFIRRYQIAAARYIQVLQFGKHQRPHSKEKASEIPAFNAKQHPPRSGKGRTKVVPSPEKVVPSTNLGNGEHALTPDSGLLTADSVSPPPTPPQPGGRNGLPARTRRKPRVIRDASLGAWQEVIPRSDQVAATGKLPPAQRLTWASVRERLSNDPAAVAAITAVGDGDFEQGCRRIAQRDKFTARQLQEKFREAYEQQCAQDTHA